MLKIKDYTLIQYKTNHLNLYFLINQFEENF